MAMRKESVAIAVIGNEILNGSTQDGNSQWLIQQLNDVGCDVGIVMVLPDEMVELVRRLHELSEEYKYVITTGGIGPTHDDITREAVAAATGRPLELNEEAAGMIAATHKGIITDVRKRMAMLPAGAELISNEQTGAPGFRVDNIFVFPGIPKLLYAMFDGIKEQFRGRQLHRRTIEVKAGESRFADILKEAQDKWPEVAIGSYPKLDQWAWVEVRACSRDEDALCECTDWLRPRLKEVEDESKRGKAD
jgi:molybdenum cofactor synthesis domain-containing protein